MEQIKINEKILYIVNDLSDGVVYDVYDAGDEEDSESPPIVSVEIIPSFDKEGYGFDVSVEDMIILHKDKSVSQKELEEIKNAIEMYFYSECTKGALGRLLDDLYQGHLESRYEYGRE